MQKPPWVNLDGFSPSTNALDMRKMNPLLDINAFGSTLARTRLLDVKGALGARPVQEWKEMLRGNLVEKLEDHSWKVPDFEPWAALPSRAAAAAAAAARMPPPPASPLLSRRASPSIRRRRSDSPSAASTDSLLPQPAQLPAPSTKRTPRKSAASESRSQNSLNDGSGFSFWGGRNPDPPGSSANRSRGAGGSGRPSSARRPKSAGALASHGNGFGGGPSPAQIAAARRKNPPRWGPEGERRLTIKSRPAWRNITGKMDADTRLSDNRKLNPFMDIQAFSGGCRPLDTKGELGNKPVQIWKEGLRH